MNNWVDIIHAINEPSSDLSKTKNVADAAVELVHCECRFLSVIARVIFVARLLEFVIFGPCLLLVFKKRMRFRRTLVYLIGCLLFFSKTLFVVSLLTLLKFYPNKSSCESSIIKSTLGSSSR